jgi:hypothetical protein
MLTSGQPSIDVVKSLICGILVHVTGTPSRQIPNGPECCLSSSGLFSSGRDSGTAQCRRRTPVNPVASVNDM